MAQRNGRTPQDFVPRRLYRYDVELETVLDLRSAAALGTVGLSRDDLTSDDLRACQAVGEAAQYLGREGIQASSATGNGEILAVFVDRLQPGSTVDAAAFEVWEAPPTSDE